MTWQLIVEGHEPDAETGRETEEDILRLSRMFYQALDAGGTHVVRAVLSTSWIGQIVLSEEEETHGTDEDTQGTDDTAKGQDGADPEA